MKIVLSLFSAIFITSCSCIPQVVKIKGSYTVTNTRLINNSVYANTIELYWIPKYYGFSIISYKKSARLIWRVKSDKLIKMNHQIINPFNPPEDFYTQYINLENMPKYGYYRLEVLNNNKEACAPLTEKVHYLLTNSKFAKRIAPYY
jgi:hypothetical protein